VTRTADRRLVAAGTVVAAGGVGPGWVEVAGDRIAASGAGAPPREPDADLGDAVLVPGFVDMHVHGGAGAAFPDGDAEAALPAVRFHRSHGSTTMIASLVTAGPDELLKSVDALAELVVDGELAGVHLEGPWLAAGRCGAHDPRQLRDPDPAELDRLLHAGNGVVRMVTLAPELEGGLDAVHRIVAAGAVAALGHTDASYAHTRAAIDAGARVGTHLFNAMAPVHHREPGPAIALLEDPRVVVELVTDGLHVHPALWEHVVRTAGTERVAAVTDAMAAAGMPDGAYHLGAMRVTVSGGVARLAGGTDSRAGAIAGSTATTELLFANIVRNAALPRPEALARAVAMTATAPARALGLADVGVIAPGKRADLVVLDPDLRVRTVYRGGAVVPPAEPAAPWSS
jgi:N-acetylglucosamine-6-phosphate deacetylase